MNSPDQKNVSQKKASFFTEYNLLKEIENNPEISQRELARRLNIGLAVTNVLIKKIAQQGWLRIQGLKPRRIVYFLTPKGFKEKSKLTYNFIRRTLFFYNEAKGIIQKELELVKKSGFDSIAVVGSGDIKEIFAIVAQGLKIPIACMVDLELSGRGDFFQIPVFPGKSFFERKFAAYDNVSGGLPKKGELRKQSEDNSTNQEIQEFKEILKGVDAIIVLDERFSQLNNDSLKEEVRDLISNKKIWEIFV